MARKRRLLAKRHLVAGCVTVALVIALAVKLAHTNVMVLNPAGPIATGQRHMLVVAFLLMLIVVIPVFILLFTFAIKYRETNAQANYQPEWDHSRIAETTWWLIPTALIAVLAVITWRGTVQYDPYRAIAPKSSTLRVQVVALDWRWLFIYPDQHVASLNELTIPVNTAVHFDITADAPMNSFWIPQLGGQVYAMPGMSTQLSLEATKAGTYYGSSANISGQGFAGMNFETKAIPKSDFTAWVAKASRQQALDQPLYTGLSQPSTEKTPVLYRAPDTTLYDTIINKYMNSSDMAGMNMEGM